MASALLATSSELSGRINALAQRDGPRMRKALVQQFTAARHRWLMNGRVPFASLHKMFLASPVATDDQIDRLASAAATLPTPSDEKWIVVADPQARRPGG